MLRFFSTLLTLKHRDGQATVRSKKAEQSTYSGHLLYNATVNTSKHTQTIETLVNILYGQLCVTYIHFSFPKKKI